MNGRAFAFAIILVTALISIFVENISEIRRGEFCDKNEYTQQKECSQHSSSKFIFLSVIKFLDHHEGSVVGIGTLAVAIFTWRLWISTKNLWTATEKTVGLAREEFDATHRPWIAADFSLTNLEMTENGIAITLHYSLKNTGTTPALNVATVYEPHLLTNMNPIEIQREISIRQRTRTHNFLEFTIFPGDAARMGMTTTVTNESLDQWVAKMPHIPKDFPFIPTITLLGCIDYRSTFSPKRFQTGFILELHRNDPAHPGMMMLIPKFGGKYPVNEVRLGYSVLGSGITD